MPVHDDERDPLDDRIRELAREVTARRRPHGTRCGRRSPPGGGAGPSGAPPPLGALGRGRRGGAGSRASGSAACRCRSEPSGARCATGDRSAARQSDRIPPRRRGASGTVGGVPDPVPDLPHRPAITAWLRPPRASFCRQPAAARLARGSRRSHPPTARGSGAGAGGDRAALPGSPAQDLELIRDGIERGDVLPRLRQAVPTGTVPNHGAL